MATKREPWDDDSDSDFQSAASFELDDSEDEARGGRVRDDDDEFVPEHEAFADEDFHECVDGLLLDEGYFGEDAYRGPPGAWADDGPSRPTSVPADRIAEADLERAAMARESEMDDANAKKKKLFGVAPVSAEVVRDAMSRAAADAMLRGVAASDEDAEDALSSCDDDEARTVRRVSDENARVSPRVPRDTGAPAPPSDRREMLLLAGEKERNATAARSAPLDVLGRGGGHEPHPVFLTRSSGNSSDEDPSRARAVDAWEEDTGAARARRARRRRAAAARDAAPSSSDEEKTEARRREAREARLRRLEAEVLEREVRARFDAAALAALEVAPSDREVLIAESRRESLNGVPAGTPGASPRFGFVRNASPTAPEGPDDRIASGAPRETRRGGGGGDGASFRDGACRSGTFDGDFADAFEREVSRDRSPGRARRGGSSRSRSSNVFFSGGSDDDDVSPLLRDSAAAGSPAAGALALPVSPRFRLGGSESSSGVEPVEVRIQRRDRAPAPTDSLPASMDPYARARRGWRAEPAEKKDAEKAWRDAVPGIALPPNPRKKGTREGKITLPFFSATDARRRREEETDVSSERDSIGLRESNGDRRRDEDENDRAANGDATKKNGTRKNAPSRDDDVAAAKESESESESESEQNVAAAETSPGRVAALRRQFEARAERASAERPADPPEPFARRREVDEKKREDVEAFFLKREETEPPRPTTPAGSGFGFRPASASGSRPRHRAAGGLGPPSRRGAAALASDPDAARFPLHAAAFYGDLDALRNAIFAALEETRPFSFPLEDAGCADTPHPSLVALDACGNTAAHVAVLRGDARALALLLDDDVCDFPVDARSASGWTLTQEATHARAKPLVRFLVAKSMERARRDAQRETQKLVAALRGVPDMTMQMRWAFGSAVFGPVLRAYAPSDTYDISKKGSRVRVDGTLRGADEERNEFGEPKSMLPKWKRGAFSMLFVGELSSDEDQSGGATEKKPDAGGSGGSAMWYLDHEKREAVDMSDESGDLAAGSGPGLEGFTQAELIDAEVDALLARGSTVKEKYEAGDVTFKPVKAWLGGDRVESVGPWRATVWEACGFVAKRRVTRAGAFRVTGTFGEYLASSREGFKDRVERKGTGLSSTGPAPASVESVESVERDVGEGDGLETLRADEKANAKAKAKETRAREYEEDERSDALSPSGGNVGGSLPGADGSSSKSSSFRKPPSDRPVTSREARRRRRAARAEKEVPKPRRVTARCWLAEGFPVRVEDVSPILDIASRANKHLKKAKRVVEYWRGAHAGKFPVKVTVPIMMTVYATIDFRNFRAAAEADEDDARPPRNKTKDEHKKDERRMDAPADFSAHTPSDPAYFEVPPGYARKTLVQALREAEEEERRQLEAEARARKAKREEAQKQKHAAKK